VALFFRFLDFVLNTVQCIFKLVSKPKANTYLQGNFGPVKNELFEKNLSVLVSEGGILNELEGEYVRNGPNPRNIPVGGYHWFDGDGMLHGVRIKDGKISYVNRWVRTQRFNEEEKGMRFIQLGAMTGIFGFLRVMLYFLKVKFGVICESLGTGTANTAVVFHDGKLMALVESDFPYALKLLVDGRFEMMGRNSYSGKLRHPFTAHPKVDPDTNELLFFGYKIAPPFLTYSIANSDGELVQSTEISIPKAVMMHDFAITPNYSVFMDLPLEFEPKSMFKNETPYVFNAQRPSRIGVIPRYAKRGDEIRWFEFAPGYIFHTINAFHIEAHEILLMGCRSSHLDLSLDSDKSVKPVPYCYHINLTTGAKREFALSDVNVDFPVIHPSLIGKPFKFAYCATFTPSLQKGPLFDGIVKFENTYPISEGSFKEVGRIRYGEHCFGGEAVFVPKKGAKAEDDGFLMTFIYDESTQRSEYVVFDAKTMSPHPLLCVVMPQRIPYGFHGIWVDENKIQHQKELQLPQRT